MRYLIPETDRDVQIYMNGHVLHVDGSGTNIEVYYSDYPDGPPPQTYNFRIYDTGELIPPYFEYLKTVLVGRTAKHVCQYFGEDEPWIPASMSDGVVLNAANLDERPLPKLDEIDPSPTP